MTVTLLAMTGVVLILDCNHEVPQTSGFRSRVMADPEGNQFCVSAACAKG